MHTYKFNTFIAENGVITIPFQEPMLYNKQVEVTILPISEQQTDRKKVDYAKEFINNTEKNTGFGCAKGRIHLSNDFDKPLEEFNEYM